MRIRLIDFNFKYKEYPHKSYFIKDLKELAKSKECKYIDTLNDIVINPQRINILHIFAHQGRDIALTLALEGGCPFIKTFDGSSPLTISLNNGFIRCTEAIIKYICNTDNEQR